MKYVIFWSYAATAFAIAVVTFREDCDERFWRVFSWFWVALGVVAFSVPFWIERLVR
jgi:hypothetical protein